MAIRALKWSNLLKLTELDFEPDISALLTISDEVLQVISWLTATTGFDRRLLRCTQQGALLIARPWSMMNIVANGELYPDTDSPAQSAALAANNGVLFATSSVIIKLGVKRTADLTYEYIYVPANSFHWIPYPCYQLIATLVPEDAATATYVGYTTFK